MESSPSSTGELRACGSLGRRPILRKFSIARERASLSASLLAGAGGAGVAAMVSLPSRFLRLLRLPADAPEASPAEGEVRPALAPISPLMTESQKCESGRCSTQ